MRPEELVTWARDEAKSLRATYSSQHGGRTGRAIEFLRMHAGERSTFYRQAAASSGGGTYQLNTVASLLDGWADLVEAGLLEQPLELRGRLDASTDLMEQVEALLKDPAVHPAAPVMLAGAALEEYLRGLVEANDITVKGKTGLAKYAEALRTADLLTPQDVKDVTSLAGTRNEAAHGAFDKISHERARLMADHVNLFLRQKAGST